MRRIIAAKVVNNSGVFNRVSSIFTRRQFNMESIAVGATRDPEIARVVIVVEATEQEVEQLVKQLYKQIDVLKVTDLSQSARIERELALIKVACSVSDRVAFQTLVEPFRAQIVDSGSKTITVQVTGTSEKIAACIELIRSYGIVEVARTGVTGIVRG